MAEFDEATYNVGIHWCCFMIRCKNSIAVFRLHILSNTNKCWEVLKALDGPKLFQDPESNCSFSYGAAKKKIETRDKLEEDDDGTLAARFAWLEDLLTAPTSGVAMTGTFLEYHGVEYYSQKDEHA